MFSEYRSVHWYWGREAEYGFSGPNIWNPRKNWRSFLDTIYIVETLAIKPNIMIYYYLVLLLHCLSIDSKHVTLNPHLALNSVLCGCASMFGAQKPGFRSSATLKRCSHCAQTSYDVVRCLCSVTLVVNVVGELKTYKLKRTAAASRQHGFLI